jgi:hypothetical protein
MKNPKAVVMLILAVVIGLGATLLAAVPFVADPFLEVRDLLAWLEQEPRAEAPDVAVGDVRAVV